MHRAARVMPSTIAVIVFVLSIFFGALYAPLDSNTSFVTRDTADYPQAKRVLLVTAHPDDEAMFFAPTILSLIPNRDISFFHVCLSNGNADGLGSTRRTELGYSLDILGVSKRSRWLLDHPELQDNFTAQWDPKVIANVLSPYVSGLKIDTILTFDSHGVSGHPNHRAIPAGVKSLLGTLNATSSSTTPRLFSLISAPMLTKYVGVGAVALAKIELHVYHLRDFLTYTTSYWIPTRLTTTFISDPSTPLFISSLADYLTALSAMLSHHSQMVWFRWLYVGWSRYMWTNTWEEIRNFS